MPEKKEITLFWFRRDLRLLDNVGLFHALRENTNVLALFIFDSAILSKLEDKTDLRVYFIYKTIVELKHELEKLGSSMLVLFGEPNLVFTTIFKKYNVKTIYANSDYEPYGIERDNKINDILAERGIPFKKYKDHLIFEPHEVLKSDKKPYTVYSPYRNQWKKNFEKQTIQISDTEKYFSNFIKIPKYPLVAIEGMGFRKMEYSFPSKEINGEIIQNYHIHRDIPSLDATSHLGLHLRMGTVSVRSVVRRAQEYNDVWLSELIWREFFSQILYHFPFVENSCFKKQFNDIQWSVNEETFKKWCEGRTGYPLVDAGMRQLNTTGFMHNRVRMVAGSFLVKHLHINWQWGEAYFASKLLDFELSSNNGNWQWVAGTGCDASPWFRIFNPEVQQKKFDKNSEYIKKWIPEYGTPEYPKEIVNHKEAREIALHLIKK